MKQTLYQLDLAGNTKVWQIEVVDNGSTADIIVSSGRLHGSMVKNVTTISEGKNIGKANQTNHLTQAMAEAQSKVDLKLREGYVYDIDDAKSSATLGSGVPQPMLAQKHSPDGSQKSSKTLAQIKILNKEVIVQPKLDGNRCTIVVKNGVPKMYTRKGDLMPVQLNHILNDVKSKLGETSEIILDGELFSQQFSFNYLNGLIKKITVTKEDENKRLQIKYHLYDIHSSVGYEKRVLFLDRFATSNIIVIPSYKIIATDANIKKYLEQFLAQGHEGLMIRQLGIGYENKRTWQLCKVKVFEDEEFELVGFEEDARGGFVGAFVMRMKDGRTFNAGASGQGVDERTEMWYNKDSYLGKMATVEFFGRSEYDIPRFPKFKGVRDV
jgi:DNA ligase 1